MAPYTLCIHCTSPDTPAHRHDAGDWLFPSATSPGTHYSTVTGLGPNGTAWSCTCSLGADPRTARRCWHAVAARAFDQGLLDAPATATYHRAANGDLTSQLTILVGELDLAIYRQDRHHARLLSRAFAKLIDASLLELPPPEPSPPGTQHPIPTPCPTCWGEPFPDASVCTRCTGGGLIYRPFDTYQQRGAA
jgi:hypothetical protein